VADHTGLPISNRRIAVARVANNSTVPPTTDRHILSSRAPTLNEIRHVIGLMPMATEVRCYAGTPAPAAGSTESD
jgi:hypothetical protein